MSIKNIGRSSCKNALLKVYLRSEQNGQKIDFTAKWVSSPEPFIEYFYERVPGTTGRNTMVGINPKGFAPSLMSNVSQTIHIPPMPKKREDFTGEAATLFCWDRGGVSNLKLEEETKLVQIGITPGLKKFSVWDFYLHRLSHRAVLKSSDYQGEIYVVGDNYCGVCGLTIKKWPEPDYKTATPADLLAASDNFDFALEPATKIKGVKRIKIVKV